MTPKIIHGDCWETLFHQDPELAQFTYIDPPFFSGRDYETRGGVPAFSDKWEDLDAYLKFLVPRVRAAWAWTGGSLVLHLDHSVCHHVEVALERFLGKADSHIIWRYRRWPTKTKNFQRVHDVLIRWARPEATWHQLYEPLAPSTLEAWGEGKQRAMFDEDGRRTRTEVTDERSPGVAMGDVWEDIGIISPSAKERTGYPTQKPKKLIERLICSLTTPGGLVLDPMMGSGTTLETAIECGRRVIGIDSSPVAIATTRARLKKHLEAA